MKSVFVSGHYMSYGGTLIWICSLERDLKLINLSFTSELDGRRVDQCHIKPTHSRLIKRPLTGSIISFLHRFWVAGDTVVQQSGWWVLGHHIVRCDTETDHRHHQSAALQAMRDGNGWEPSSAGGGGGMGRGFLYRSLGLRDLTDFINSCSNDGAVL